MKMRKLFAALTGAVTALTVCASLSAQATDVKYVFQRTKQGVWTEITDPALLAEGHGYAVSNRTLQGFLAYSEDWQQVAEIGGMPGTAEAPDDGSICCLALKPDYLTLREELDANHVSVNLPENYMTDQYRLLSPHKKNMPLIDFVSGTEWGLKTDDWQTLLDGLEAEDSPVTLLGAVYRSTVQQTVFMGDIHIEAEPEFWNETHPQAVLDALKQDGFTGTLEEAYAFCETLAQDPYVIECYPCNELLVSEDSVDQIEYALLPVSPFGSGDLDENGKTNVLDAVMLARTVAEDAALTVSAQGRTNADMNGDGTCTFHDLTLLLRLLAGIGE